MVERLKILSSKLRKALAQLPQLFRALQMVWQVARSWTIAWVVLLLIQELLPAASVYLIRLVVDRFVSAVKTGAAWHLRRLITVLFQQPVHYNATARENIEYGDRERRFPMSSLETAVQAAGAEPVLSRLSAGYETMLGRWLTGGTELSVGEWQRIALARAFLIEGLALQETQ